MTLDGQPFHPAQPRAARAQGIAMVFQHFSLFEALTVAENIALGMETPSKPAILSQTIVETSAKYGLSLEPSRLIGDLSVGERQRVEIVRCLIQNPKLLIMDEPTSVLTPQEVARLFKTLRQLQSEGTAIYIHIPQAGRDKNPVRPRNYPAGGTGYRHGRPQTRIRQLHGRGDGRGKALRPPPPLRENGRNLVKIKRFITGIGRPFRHIATRY